MYTIFFILIWNFESKFLETNTDAVLFYVGLSSLFVRCLASETELRWNLSVRNFNVGTLYQKWFDHIKSLFWWGSFSDKKPQKTTQTPPKKLTPTKCMNLLALLSAENEVIKVSSKQAVVTLNSIIKKEFLRWLLSGCLFFNRATSERRSVNGVSPYCPPLSPARRDANVQSETLWLLVNLCHINVRFTPLRSTATPPECARNTPSIEKSTISVPPPSTFIQCFNMKHKTIWSLWRHAFFSLVVVVFCF